MKLFCTRYKIFIFQIHFKGLYNMDFRKLFCTFFHLPLEMQVIIAVCKD